MAAVEDGGSEGAPVFRRRAGYRFRPSLRSWLIGRPLPTADAPHQTLSAPIGMAVFAGDALSSVAYAPQETLVILAAAGLQGLSLAIPISLAVTVLLVIVALSYLQTIHAYPDGGGAYTVARENLGTVPALGAGAALLIDYTLLAAVATSSGVAQIVSAAPALFPYRVWLAVGLIFLVMLANLRGVRESGAGFAVPTYCFLVVTYVTVIAGFARLAFGRLGALQVPDTLLATPLPVTLFLILRAFSNGTTALTGVECIANGVTAFREPRTRNAAKALIWMTGILGSLYLGITFLLGRIHAYPSETETVVSQLARVVWNGRGPLYLAVVTGTTVVLLLAANTAFADFPRLSAIMARDGFLPRQLAFRGSRLVYSWGIGLLGGLASLLVVLFQASVTRLVPLWAVGVFLSFTLSQAGMARRWWRVGHAGGTGVHTSGAGWRWKMVLNGLGGVCTGVVTLIFAMTKFVHGAWVIVLLIPLLVAMFLRIRAHYRSLAQALSLEAYGSPPPTSRHRVILPIGGVHRGTLAALRYARSLSHDVTAVHVSIDPAQADEVRRKWREWGQGVRLVILDSPYRLLLEPLLDYIGEILSHRQPNEVLTIVVPQFVPRRWWHNLLHTQTAMMLRLALLLRPGVVVTDVPYHPEEPAEESVGQNRRPEPQGRERTPRGRGSRRCSGCA
ncbi:MAG: APC family permease [Chloroflexia bacterium]